MNGVLKRQRLQAMADNKFVQDNLIGLKKTSHEWFVTINFYLAKQQKENPVVVIGEHLLIGLIVILITNFIGGWIPTVFS